MGILITNYRTRDIAPEALGSYNVRLRQSWQHDSATGNIISFSMDGFGRPTYVLVKIAGEDHRMTFFQINVSISASQSVCYASIMPCSLSTANSLLSMGSLAATLTLPYEIFALIASR